MSRAKDGRGREARRREAGGNARRRSRELKEGEEGQREALRVAFDFDSHSCSMSIDRSATDQSVGRKTGKWERQQRGRH